MAKLEEIGFHNYAYATALLEETLGTVGLDEVIFPASSLDMPDLRLFNLVEAYRFYGHLKAKTCPIETVEKEIPELNLERFGFKPDDLQSLFPTLGLLQKTEAPLIEIIQQLEKVYCGSVGVEYMGLDRINLEKWLQEKIEKTGFSDLLSIEQKKEILEKLNQAELFETFIHTKYVGQKRFSLEGGETLIPMLNVLIQTLASNGASHVIIGMSHRGRLNVLTNILGKSYKDIFSEFQDITEQDSFEGSGDVKYHKGYQSKVQTSANLPVHLTVAPNPSHLEAVDPVVEGEVRARQDMMPKEEAYRDVVPVLIHGDAAISGQGVVYETIQMVSLPGYKTGGTIHIVVNNNIGFTTLPEDGRSTTYCTAIASAFQSPVFHVNAEQPEEAVFATLLAAEIRQRFLCDVFLDLNCYRKYGHNESDEPAYTQPLQYQMIRQKKTIRQLYSDRLIHHNLVEKQLAEKFEAEFRDKLKTALEMVLPNEKKQTKQERAFPHFEPVKTGVPLKSLQQIAHKLKEVPADFHIHPKIATLVQDREKMTEIGEQAKKVDWGMGESLAYGTLLTEGYSIRISGQDVARGTFSHRQAMWVDQVTAQKYFPLNHLSENQGHFWIYNSHLSEFGVLGFEYGYSIASPNTLVIWEAQFGDFANSAQVIIDQFIVSAEEKWGRRSGLVMLLPHGYEGQGPEHSSARIERFLSLAGDGNIQVVYPTQPAQMFHLLRRQMIGKRLKPLIVFTPKGLLRNPHCTDSIEAFTKGEFFPVLDDPSPPQKTERIAFCSGRVYYDLLEQNDRKKTTRIVRIEELYPFPEKEVKHILEQNKNAKEILWVQEEPANMGPWWYIQQKLRKVMPQGMQLGYIGRSTSASPAVGSHSMHEMEHDSIIEEFFKGEK